ncbi:ankyrin repeat and MYND domain-containing protein 2 [Cylas formicarius]|uniref:ankyrin repeat and MYND domain-containing protein 2 n=1 Tax=Cylas formicarius TaxID=197179 RepID=UPI002958C3ED|nr:ankyrin repeat and MYND domain-containing protein 2 [Cylas formicarius]
MSESQEVSDIEKKIFEAIEKNDALMLKTLLTEVQDVNFLDENLMTPLQHGAYKGSKEIVQMLLDKGADVNLCEHQHNYTALHFAGLSGSTDVCLALLNSGAKSNVTNTVGRTPSQMAAFVGHHNCVAIINNYVPKEDVIHYTHSNGTDKEPLLPSFLVESFHKFIMQININPVKVILNVYSFVGLQDHLQEIKKVLELMCEREMKKGSETNEVMSFKFHYLAYILKEIVTLRQRQLAKKESNGTLTEDKKIDVTEIFTRKLLKPGKDGSYEFMNDFLMDCLREYPFRDTTLFRQMVTSLAGQEAPSALSVVTAAINGQRGFLDNVPTCDTCGEEKPSKKCSKCKVVQYCDRNCQRLHWHWHKKSCARIVPEPSKAAPSVSRISSDIQNLLVN